MKVDLMNEVISLNEAQAKARPSPEEFEIAYQARIAMDRIRFAIRQSEVFGIHSGAIREANLQLLDALDRLDSGDRHHNANGATPRSDFRTTARGPEGRRNRSVL